MKITLRDIIGRIHRLNLIRHIYAKKTTAGLGLFLGQPAILEYLITHNGCTQKEIADEMQITAASIAITVKRMQKAGLLDRITDESNQRCNKLFITVKGQELSQKCKIEFDRMDLQMFAGFSEKDLEQLSQYLDLIINNISNEEFAGKTFFSLLALGNELDKKHKNLQEEQRHD